jgi:DNA-binding LacI/PurR family transcriptional regulator
MAISLTEFEARSDEGRSNTVTLEDIAKVAGVTAMTVSRVMQGKPGASEATRKKVLSVAEALQAQVKLDEGRSKTVTLEDIAKVAGVTAMTVSRVMQGKPGVLAATREKVLGVAKELNYTANLSARALKTGRTGAIAVVSGTLNRMYNARIVHLLETELRSSGYQMRLLHTHDELQDLINATNAAAVDGVIVAGMHDLVEEFRSLDPHIFQPCVFIDNLMRTDTDCVYNDAQSAVEEALQLMMEAGRKRIAFFKHSRLVTDPKFPETRQETYRAVMKRAGRVPELISLSSNDDISDLDKGLILKKYIHDHGCPDAVLCFNDRAAMLLYRELLDLGYRVPGDLLLVGCDDIPFMKYFDPPLSTIAQPAEEICKKAWEFLQARIANPDLPFQQAHLKCELIIRRSLCP